MNGQKMLLWRGVENGGLKEMIGRSITTLPEEEEDEDDRSISTFFFFLSCVACVRLAAAASSLSHTRDTQFACALHLVVILFPILLIKKRRKAKKHRHRCCPSTIYWMSVSLCVHHPICNLIDVILFISWWPDPINVFHYPLPSLHLFLVIRWAWLNDDYITLNSGPPLTNTNINRKCTWHNIVVVVVV
jgi:hypothetical protein